LYKGKEKSDIEYEGNYIDTVGCYKDCRCLYIKNELSYTDYEGMYIKQ